MRPGINLVETFSYDRDNRLTNATLTGQATKSCTYDRLGNLLGKTGVG